MSLAFSIPFCTMHTCNRWLVRSGAMGKSSGCDSDRKEGFTVYSIDLYGAKNSKITATRCYLSAMPQLQEDVKLN